MLKKVNYKALLGMLTITMGLTLSSCSNINTSTLDKDNEKKIENMLENDEISLSDLYINFYNDEKKCDVTTSPVKNSFKSICLYDLANYYEYNFEYNKDIYQINPDLDVYKSNIICKRSPYTMTKKQIKELISKIKTEIKESKIDIDMIIDTRNLGFNYDYVIEDGILTKHRYLSKLKLGESENIDSLYSDLITSTPSIDKKGNKYVKKGMLAIDYILLKDNKVYSKEIDELLNQIVNITKKDVNKLKNMLLKECPFDYEDNSIRFDPNNKEEIDKAISLYSTLSGNNNDVAAIFYAAINKELLTEDSINYLKRYCIDLDECLDKIWSMSYSICYQDHIEELIAQNAYYNLAKFTKEEDKKIEYKPKDIKELYLLKTMYYYLYQDLLETFSLKNTNSVTNMWIYYNMCENNFKFTLDLDDVEDDMKELMEKYWNGLNTYVDIFDSSYVYNSYIENKTLKPKEEVKILNYE